MNTNECVILDAIRTPIAKGHAQRGALRALRPDALFAHVINALLDRNAIAPAAIEEVIAGCVTQTGEQGGNISRLAVLLSNLDDTSNGFSLNRACGSAQEAIHIGAAKIDAGDLDYVIAGGVESMSHVAMFSDLGGYDKVNPALMKKIEIVHQGESAERVCIEYDITREQMDDFSAQSHQRAHAAVQRGFYRKLLAPIEGLDAEGKPFLLDYDEGIRAEIDREKMAHLNPVFRPLGEGRITGGNASQISDGAAALLLGNRARAVADGLKPRARFRARCCAAGNATMALLEVMPAAEKALKKAGLSLKDIDVVEINEAFANVPLLWAKCTGADMARINPNGGAVAHGHPLGATGAILMGKLLQQLEDTDGQFGLQIMCIAHGQATATIIERI